MSVLKAFRVDGLDRVIWSRPEEGVDVFMAE
jgi:hypothetical protein